MIRKVHKYNKFQAIRKTILGRLISTFLAHKCGIITLLNQNLITFIYHISLVFIYQYNSIQIIESEYSFKSTFIFYALSFNIAPLFNLSIQTHIFITDFLHSYTCIVPVSLINSHFKR